jgi:dihydrofolate synthase / folylpolyglutamate synthase
MRFNTLAEWLNWQESLNPKEIDLGLDRVSRVLELLKISTDYFCPVITVAGTNGKGSTVAFIESMLHQAELSVGCYTSPHLFTYNERIRVNKQCVSDEDLCEAFEVIDQARADVPLTYFEFGTLASLVIFQKYNIDVAVLEVGLGGRLDAVNVIDADVSVITSIDIDHIDWLGDNVEVIAREKAGIMRAHKPSVISLFKPPASLLGHAQELNVPLQRLGQDYLYQRLANNTWQLKAAGVQLDDLPLPNLQGGFQLQNAAAAIMAIKSLKLLAADKTEHIQESHIKNGLQNAQLSGRYQKLRDRPEVIVDVAHNEQSATKLAELLNDEPVTGKTIAVIAMLADKAVNEVMAVTQSEVDTWISAGLSVPRGMSAKNMSEAVRGVGADVRLTACESVTDACKQALAITTENDRIIVFGSFYTVAEAITFFNENS